MLAERLFLHLTEADSRRAAGEIFRTLKPGGRLVVLDIAASEIEYLEKRASCAPEFTELTAVLLDTLRGLFKNGDAGKQALTYLREQGFGRTSQSVLEFRHTSESLSLTQVGALRRRVEQGEIAFKGEALPLSRFERWAEELLQAVREGVYAVSTPLYLTIGLKPGRNLHQDISRRTVARDFSTSSIALSKGSKRSGYATSSDGCRRT